MRIRSETYDGDPWLQPVWYVSRQLHIGTSGSVFNRARSGRYAIGQQKRCYYDARNPANAVLERHFAPTWPLLALVCGTFIAIMGPKIPAA